MYHNDVINRIQYTSTITLLCLKTQYSDSESEGVLSLLQYCDTHIHV
jgi:hypothetical protein